MIAVIVATEREADAVRGVLPPDAVLFRSGVGKVNAAVAAMSAALAGAKAVVNVGLAGAVVPRTKAGSAWCVDGAVQYDVDLSAVDGADVGTVDGRTSPLIYAVGFEKVREAENSRENVRQAPCLRGFSHLRAARDPRDRSPGNLRISAG